MDNKKQKHIEPLLWSIFGAGGAIASLFLPPIVLIFGIMMPLGLLGGEEISYTRMSHFLDWWIVKLFVTGVIFTTAWLACHRIYHALHDIGIHPPKKVKNIFYGIAIILGGLSLIFCIAI